MANGLASVTADELRRAFGKQATIDPHIGEGRISFEFRGALPRLLAMKTVLAVYLVRRFEIRRPQGLLGDANLRMILADIKAVRTIAPAGAFQTFHISAAGGGSPVMMRIKSVIAAETRLVDSGDNGDLQLRIRPSTATSPGWEVLTRLSPRPLTARSWRVRHMQGGLDASVAHAMALLTEPRPADTFVNLCCGSGTILIERLGIASTASAIGCDTSPAALECARKNVDAASARALVQLNGWDVRDMPLPDASVDALCADLPFGTRVGSHEGNRKLYGPMLAEAARIARDGAGFCLLTGDIRLMEDALSGSVDWEIERKIRVRLAGLVPCIFLLRRHGRAS